MNKKIVIPISVVVILVLFVVVIMKQTNKDNQNQIIENSSNIKNLPIKTHSSIEQIDKKIPTDNLSEASHLENKINENENVSNNTQVTESSIVNKLQSKEEYEIVEALDQILLNPKSQFIPFIIPLLKSSTSLISDMAIRTLGVVGRNADTSVQQNIIDEMKQIIDNDVLKTKGKDYGLQIYVYEALGDLSSIEGLTMLENSLEQVGDLSVQRAAVDSIGKIKQKSSIPSLIKYRDLLQKHQTANDFDQELKLELLEFINSTMSLL